MKIKLSTNEKNICKNGKMERSFCSTATVMSSDDYGGDYDAASIRAELKSYQSILPKPHILLQHQHSLETLREMIQLSNDRIEMPRFLKYECEGGIQSHHALCSLLLEESSRDAPKESDGELVCMWIGSWMVRALSFGYLQRQRNLPAEIIREQFNRIGHVIPSDRVTPEVLRNTIRNRGLPIPNFFLDPEDDKQFPPHIAMLIILLDGEEESDYLGNILYTTAWFLLSFVALILRLVLEVIGGAGAIWGGSEVFYLRNAENAEQCRAASIAVGVFCFIRFVVLNAPQHEDEGDILGPAGPWSLRVPARMRAVTEHPFHLFARARRRSNKIVQKQDNHSLSVY